MWEQGESFGGKRPFGNSGWEYEIYDALNRAGLASYHQNKWGDMVISNRNEADAMILSAIQHLAKG